MAKVYVFTLDFTFKRQKVLNALALLQQFSPPTSISQIYSQEDELGYSQYFRSNKPHLMSERIEVHSFSRIFKTKTQVELAAQHGCHDIKKFYSLISDVKLTENIHIICRIIIHGSLKSDNGFQMEDFSQNDENKRAYIAPDLISKIITQSIPYEWSMNFTHNTPLNIQLVACSAGGTKNYFHLESESLASRLIKSLYTKNVIATIQAATTSINYIADYWQFEMRDDPIVLYLQDTKTAFDALFHELYYRRGFENALHHVNTHLLSAHDIDTIKLLEEYLLTQCKKYIYLDVTKIIQLKKVGNKLLYSLTLNNKIEIKDYSTGKKFIDEKDYLFEAHRDILLGYFWIEYIYNVLGSLNSVYRPHKVAASNNDILFFIDQIECAANRTEFLKILNACERTLSRSLQHTHSHQPRIKKLLGYIFQRKSWLTHCELQDINIKKWDQNFYWPNTNVENFFNHQI